MGRLPSRIAHYEVLAPIGAGGMGEVYRARDTRLGREVALKVLPDTFAADRDRLARFEREAKALASLNHPNIAHVYGFDVARDVSPAVHVLVMELVEGEDLSQRLKRGAVPVDDALPIARQIAEALEAAHDHGIIHRDLKPANIKVTPDGSVKVLDFGLAKAIDSPESSNAVIHESPTITTPAMTMRGVILGTAAYMSPEQAKGKPVDRRADIWAFGCVLYEMLSGQRAFTGDDVSETLASVLKDQPVWGPLPAETPVNVRRLLERCLQKDPRKRLPHIGVARMELDEPREVEPAPVGARRATPWIALASLLAVVLAIVVTRWVPWRSEPSQSSLPVHMSIDLGADASLRNTTGPSAVLSPDGRMLAFAAVSDQARLYVRSLDRLEATQLAGTEGASDPFFSPNGQWIAFFAGGKLKKVAVNGGAPVALADISRPHGGSWGDDDRIVFMPSPLPGPLRRVPAAGGPIESLPPTSDPALRVQRWPQVLPGAKAVLFTAHPMLNGLSDGRLAVQTVPGGAIKIVHRGGYYGRYLPSGHLVFVNAGTLFAVRFDLDRLETIGTPTPVLSNIVGNPDNGGAQFAFANDGSLVAMMGKELSTAQPISWIDAEGGTKPLLAKPTDWANINVSPDGNRVAVNVRDSLTDVWVQDTTRETLFRLPASTASKDYPVWSADGRRITFSSSESGNSINNLYWQPADGSAPMQRLTTSPNPQRAGSWHPDGRVLAFHEINRKTSNDIWILPMEGDEQSGWKPGTPTPFVTDAAAQVDPVFSPDGKWIAYWSLESGAEVFVRPYPGPGGKWQISSGGGQFPAWSRTRSELFFVSMSGQVMVASYRVIGDEFRAERPRLWSNVRLMERGAGQRFWALHPDGAHIAGVLRPPDLDEKRDKLLLVLNFFDELRRSH